MFSQLCIGIKPVVEGTQILCYFLVPLYKGIRVIRISQFSNLSSPVLVHVSAFTDYLPPAFALDLVLAEVGR